MKFTSLVSQLQFCFESAASIRAVSTTKSTVASQSAEKLDLRLCFERARLQAAP